MIGQRKAFFDFGPRAVLVGNAPSRPDLDQCVPFVGERLGRSLENLAGLPPGHLVYHFACVNLLTRYAAQFSPLRRRRAEATKLRRSLPGRVLILLGEPVRQAFQCEGLDWGEWYDDRGDWLICCIPHPFRSQSRDLARDVLRQAEVAALGFGIWDPGGTTLLRTRNAT